MKSVILRPYSIAAPRSRVQTWRVRPVRDAVRSNYGEGMDASQALALAKAVQDYATRQLRWNAYTWQKTDEGMVMLTKLSTTKESPR